MKAVDGSSGRILGAAIFGIEDGEVASVPELAMMGGLPCSALRDGVFSHPTLSESLMESAEVFFGQATHVYRPRR